MKKIGLVVAVEIGAALKKYGTPEIDERHGTLIYQTDAYTLYVQCSGAGEIFAAAATQTLIDLFNVDLVANYGVVGGLTSEMQVAKTCVVERVVHYDRDTSSVDHIEVMRYAEYDSKFIPTTESLVNEAVRRYPELWRVTCASGDKFIADIAKKKTLRYACFAEICDMESAAIVLICNKNKVPCLLIKTVSDSIAGGAEEYKKEIDRASELCLDVLGGIIEGL